MSSQPTQSIHVGRAAPTRAIAPTWWLVFRRELADLWVGGRAFYLIILFSILLGLMAYVLASNSELSLIPPKEMVFLTLQAAIATGLFIALIIGADSFSGERERATLEALLLTPTSRRQIVLGKFLAAISAWPACLALAIPYLHVLAQGDPVFGQAVLWGAGLGSLLAVGLTGFGMLVSIWSNSNKTSLFVSLTAFLLCLLPTQFPGNAQTGTYGRWLKQVNPMESINHFLEKVLVNNRTLEELSIFLQAPIIFTVAVLVLLWLAGGRLRLVAGGEGRLRRSLMRLVGLGVLVALLLPGAALAQSGPVQAEAPALEIAIDTDYKVVKNGDQVIFSTIVTNNGSETSPDLILAMNIINLDGDGDPVDPEDWSPQRTQAIEPLPPGEFALHLWQVNTILEGDYMVYMVLVPAPDGPQATSHPLTSSGVHITVERFIRTNPGGVLPYAVGIPAVLMLGAALTLWRQRRGADAE